VTDDPTTVRKILLALDGAKSGAANLDVAVDLAMRFQAELIGLFVEDTDLLSVAALPFSRQVNLSTATAHPLLHGDLERVLATGAGEARRRLSGAADLQQVKWSFHTVRGRAINEVTAAAADADLVIVEGGRPGARQYENIGLSPRSALQRVSQSLLILRADQKFTRTVTVVFDGSALSRKALNAAAGFIGPGDRITVLLCAERRRAAMDLATDARNVLGSASVAAEFKPLDTWSLRSFGTRGPWGNPGLVMLGANNPLASAAAGGGDILGLLDIVKCPVWIVQ
jgi:nucleotide-binding universal stress UspA family protein